MKNQLIRISMEDAWPYAREYFINICGFRNKEGEKYKRMLEHGMQIRERIADRVDLKAVVSSFDRNVISGNTAKIDGATFVCNAFEQLNRDSIQKIYAYLFTSGSFELKEDEPVIDQLYSDIWGTAYTDAGLEVLKHHLKADFDRSGTGKPTGTAGSTGSTGSTDSTSRSGSTGGDSAVAGGRKAVILDSFGPGYYGMDVDQIGRFFQILDGDSIGVRARTNSLMLPLKSCAGFYIIVDDDTRLPSADCANCHSDHSGCEFCQSRIRNTQ